MKDLVLSKLRITDTLFPSNKLSMQKLCIVFKQHRAFNIKHVKTKRGGIELKWISLLAKTKIRNHNDYGFHGGA